MEHVQVLTHAHVTVDGGEVPVVHVSLTNYIVTD